MPRCPARLFGAAILSQRERQVLLAVYLLAKIAVFLVKRWFLFAFHGTHPNVTVFVWIETMPSVCDVLVGLELGSTIA